MIPREYQQFRNADGCGWMMGTARSGPSVCGNRVRFTATVAAAGFQHTMTVNGKVCGGHARTACVQGYTVNPLTT